MKGQKPPNCSLELNLVGVAEFPGLKESIFFFVFKLLGSLRFVAFAMLMKKATCISQRERSSIF